MREYPPILTGDADNKAAQIRGYLVRLCTYLDEMAAANTGTTVPVSTPETVLPNQSKMLRAFLDGAYPVGSVYISVNDTDPGSIFGGTWERIKDTFLLSAGDTYAAGSTGGEAEHTLSIGEIPSHEGHLDRNIGVCYVGNTKLYLPGTPFTSYTTARGWNNNGSEMYPAGVSRGSGQAHNNMPPYLAVYVWKRTA
jgi:hypothetical protein